LRFRIRQTRLIESGSPKSCGELDALLDETDEEAGDRRYGLIGPKLRFCQVTNVKRTAGSPNSFSAADLPISVSIEHL